MARPVSMTKVPTYTSYEEWMRAEGIPIVEEECGIRDVTTLERQPWPRLEGKGAFIYLEGLKEAGFTGLYVVEIPPHGALAPEKHLYEEMMYVLRGQGTAEFWHEAGGRHVLE